MLSRFRRGLVVSMLLGLSIIYNTSYSRLRVFPLSLVCMLVLSYCLCFSSLARLVPPCTSYFPLQKPARAGTLHLLPTINLNWLEPLLLLLLCPRTLSLGVRLHFFAPARSPPLGVFDCGSVGCPFICSFFRVRVLWRGLSSSRGGFATLLSWPCFTFNWLVFCGPGAGQSEESGGGGERLHPQSRGQERGASAAGSNRSNPSRRSRLKLV